MDYENAVQMCVVAVVSLLTGGLVTKWLCEKFLILKVNQNKTKEDDYIEECSLRENPHMKDLREKTIKELFLSSMMSDPVQVQHFQMILKSINAKKCIEVGTFTGYNALNCALTIPKDGVVYALDTSEKYVSYGKTFFEKANVAHKIKIMIGNASDSLDELINNGHSGTIDFIFIDADKDNYDLYYEKSLILLRKGGIIALDNMLWQGLVYDPSRSTSTAMLKAADALRTLAIKLHKDERVDVSFLKMKDGVYFCRKL